MIFLDILLETCVVNRKIPLLTCMREMVSQPSLSKCAIQHSYQNCFLKHELSVVANSLDLKQPVGRVSLHTLFSHSCIGTHLFHPHSYFSPVGHEPICYILLYNSHPLLDLPMLGASQLLPFKSKPVASVNLFCRRQEEPEPDWEIHRHLET